MLIFVISLLAINNKWSKSEMSIGVLKRKFNFRLKCKNTRIFHYNLLWSNKRSRKKNYCFVTFGHRFITASFVDILWPEKKSPLWYSSRFSPCRKVGKKWHCCIFASFFLTSCCLPATGLIRSGGRKERSRSISPRWMESPWRHNASRNEWWPPK